MPQLTISNPPKMLQILHSTVSTVVILIHTGSNNPPHVSPKELANLIYIIIDLSFLEYMRVWATHTLEIITYYYHFGVWPKVSPLVGLYFIIIFR